MRRLLTNLVVAATTVLIPMLGIAGNQEAADKIAKALSSSGQMYDYKIGVKFQGGTVWLRGQVASQEQAQTAVTLVRQMAGVNEVVNGLTIVSATTTSAQRAVVPTSTPSDLQAVDGAVAPEQVGRTAMAPQNVAPVRTGYAHGAVAASYEQPAAPRAIPVTATAAPQRTAVQTAQAGMQGPPMPVYNMACRGQAAPARYDQPSMPNYAWPSYAAYPNYAAVSYPKQYSPTAWPYIGPFYPYPQVPLGWRKVTLQWDDGWWMLDFKDK